MIVIDANLLLYAYNLESPHHLAARRWLEETVNAGETLGVPWITTWAFLRIATNPRLFHPPMAVDKALHHISNILNLPNTIIVEPGPRHMQILRHVVVEGQAVGPTMTDAVLAALAIEHGATLASADRGFSRFEGLKWMNPLAA